MTHGIEWELDDAGNLTGRWRKRQFYAKQSPNGKWLRLPPSELQASDWREGVPR